MAVASLATMTTYSWQQLSHEEVWAVDFEYYPGPGLANGGRRVTRQRPSLSSQSRCERAGSFASGRMNSVRSRRTGSMPAHCS